MDQATLSQLVGALATDIVKIGITTGASITAAVSMGGFSIAIGPIFAVVVIGFGTSWALGVVDERLGITDRVVDGLDDIGVDVQLYIAKKRLS